MYNKIQNLNEVKELDNVPKEVLSKIKETVKSLDENYGVNRNEDEDGGYVIFVTNQDDLDLVCELEIDVETCTVEYAETITTTEETYINALFLLNNEFAINVIMPERIAPKNILEEI